MSCYVVKPDVHQVSIQKLLNKFNFLQLLVVHQIINVTNVSLNTRVLTGMVYL
jgi:hypothetical protein